MRSAPTRLSCYDPGSNDAARGESEALRSRTTTGTWQALTSAYLIPCADNFLMLRSWLESNWITIPQPPLAVCEGSRPIGIGSISFWDRCISLPARLKCLIGSASWNSSNREVCQARSNNTSWNWRNSFPGARSIAWLTWISLRSMDCDHMTTIQPSSFYRSFNWLKRPDSRSKPAPRAGENLLESNILTP